MTEVSTSSYSIAENATSQPMAYSCTWEYLSAELRRLDLIIALEVHRQRINTTPDPLDQFKGLVLSESEISSLLQSVTRRIQPGPFDSSYQTLNDALDDTEREIAVRRAATLSTGVFLSHYHLAQLFQLTSFEQDCLLVCLAPEIDRKYEKLYAYLQDDVTRKKPSVSLVLNLLLKKQEERIAARSIFDPQAPLLRFRLLRLMQDPADQTTPLISRFLKLDDRIVSFLLATPGDPLSAHGAQLILTNRRWNEIKIDTEISDQLRAFVTTNLRNADVSRDFLFYFSGLDGGAKQLLAEAVAGETGRSLLLADAGKIISGGTPVNEVAWLIAREAVLSNALLCLERVDLLFEDDEKLSFLVTFIEAAHTFSTITFLFGTRSWKPLRLPRSTTLIKLELPLPKTIRRMKIWADSLGSDGNCIDRSELAVLASKFRLTTHEITEAVKCARDLAAWRAPHDSAITLSDLYEACRAQSHHQLQTLARQIVPIYSWSDIVLPDDSRTQLKELCARVAERHRVLHEWGFGRKLSLGKGVNALFAGPSGTGKTMAAEIIANELGLELYKIDLSAIVSKYIGETEKNLDRVFSTAENANAILFFDEADALFGKRSEVRDSHDRYANIEISYLLQKMEQYEGVAILATNLRQNLDDAFLRRLQFIIEFPFPDESQRSQIWSVLFPPEAPRDQEIDFQSLARQFRVAGGNIKNIALGAAYLAAADGCRISMNHLLQSAKREYQKLGKAE